MAKLTKKAAAQLREHLANQPQERPVELLLAQVERNPGAGRAEAVIELTEYALGRVDKAMGTIDDSSGWFSQIVADLERLHHEACVVPSRTPWPWLAG